MDIKVEDLKIELSSVVNDNQKKFEEISEYIFHNPELGGEEIKSSEYLARFLEKEGFTVSFPYAKLPTAFIAEYGMDNAPTIGFLAEYDALPGYGPNGEPMHACGHNWIAATMIGCGVSLSKLQNFKNCKLKIIGTPAEETFGGKYDLVKFGAFNNMDIAFQAHLDEVNAMETITLAMNSLEFTFRGKASHAAAFPENGINALDGVLSMFSGVNALRQHLKSEVRIHGIITDGGKVTNIVPEIAVCRFTIRAKDKTYLKYIRERLIKIAEGSSLISGASLSYEDYENPFDDMVNVPALIEVTKSNFNNQGISNFIDTANYPSAGSSDVGNVSYVCPTLYVELDPETGETFMIHDKSALKVVNSKAAYKKINQTIKSIGGTVIEILCTEGKLEEIKRQHLDLI